MQRLIMQAAQQYPQDQRQRFTEYVQSDPMAAAQLRAPLYEDKVVDFLFDKAIVTDRETTRAELEAAIEAEDDGVGKAHVHGPDCDHDHDHAAAAEPMVSEDTSGVAASADAASVPAKAKRVTKKATVPPAATDQPLDAAPAEATKPKRAPANKQDG